MVEFATGNLLDADVDALVNTVNTKGVMGKGIALQFRRAFPANYEAYRVACEAGEVRLGRMFVVMTGRLERPRLIINFPTKAHWKSRSRIADIESGLRDLRRVIEEWSSPWPCHHWDAVSAASNGRIYAPSSNQRLATCRSGHSSSHRRGRRRRTACPIAASVPA